MDPILSNFNSSLQNIVFQLKEDLKSIRTGRANPSMIEGMMIETYGGQTKLKLMELATILTEGASVIVIQPYDPSTTQDIERAILKSPLGLSPQAQGQRISVRIPPLSQEQREKMAKLIGQKVEEKRVMARNIRDESRKKIRIQFDGKEISEDERYRLEKEIDNINQKYLSEINSIKESKEQEIMAV